MDQSPAVNIAGTPPGRLHAEQHIVGEVEARRPTLLGIVGGLERAREDTRALLGLTDESPERVNAIVGIHGVTLATLQAVDCEIHPVAGSRGTFYTGEVIPHRNFGYSGSVSIHLYTDGIPAEILRTYEPEPAA